MYIIIIGVLKSSIVCMWWALKILVIDKRMFTIVQAGLNWEDEIAMQTSDSWGKWGWFTMNCFGFRFNSINFQVISVSLWAWPDYNSRSNIFSIPLTLKLLLIITIIVLYYIALVPFLYFFIYFSPLHHYKSSHIVFVIASSWLGACLKN